MSFNSTLCSIATSPEFFSPCCQSKSSLEVTFALFVFQFFLSVVLACVGFYQYRKDTRIELSFWSINYALRRTIAVNIFLYLAASSTCGWWIYRFIDHTDCLCELLNCRMVMVARIIFGNAQSVVWYICLCWIAIVVSDETNVIIKDIFEDLTIIWLRRIFLLIGTLMATGVIAGIALRIYFDDYRWSAVSYVSRELALVCFISIAIYYIWTVYRHFSSRGEAIPNKFVSFIRLIVVFGIVGLCAASFDFVLLKQALSDPNLSVFNRMDHTLGYYPTLIILLTAALMYFTFGPSSSSSAALAPSSAPSIVASTNLKVSLASPLLIASGRPMNSDGLPIPISTPISIVPNSPLCLRTIQSNMPISSSVDEYPVDLS